ncbi:MAG: hypothetical protein AB7N71_11335, partial [Phycisphaerae bacterium]
MNRAPRPMHCLKCEYDLRGVADCRCPECGRAFDPDDDATFATPEDVLSPRQRWLFRILRVIALAPLIPHVFLVAAWLSAWEMLGHPPSPYVDDPKSISNPSVTWFIELFWGSTVFGCGLPILLVMSLMGIGLLRSIYRPKPRLEQGFQREVFKTFIFWSVTWGVSIGLFFSDPLDQLAWKIG